MKPTGTNFVGCNPSRGRVDNDYYATPVESTLALLEVEKINYPVLEPACGEGHIVKLLLGEVISDTLHHQRKVFYSD